MSDPTIHFPRELPVPSMRELVEGLREALELESQQYPQWADNYDVENRVVVRLLDHIEAQDRQLQAYYYGETAKGADA